MRRSFAWLVLGLIYFIPLVSLSQKYHPVELTPYPDLSKYPWIYLRQGQSPADIDYRSDVILVGDILCGREGDSTGLDLNKAAPWLRSADLTIGNLECVINSNITSPGKLVPHKADSPILLYGAPLQASLLRKAGFDLLGMANNHAFDLGSSGLEDTQRILRQNGIHPVGLRKAGDCEILPEFENLGSLRIAILALNAIPFEKNVGGSDVPDKFDVSSWQESSCILPAIKAARQEANAVIVSIHWGYEYETRIDPVQQEIANQLVAAGADLVVGHHPHVAQGLEIISSQGNQPDSLVAYSLGNFLADQQFGETGKGLALRAFFDDRGLLAVQALPVEAGPQPELLNMAQAGSFIDRIIPEPTQVIFSCDGASCMEKKSADLIEHKASDSGLFWSGEIDLTGDNAPEQIQRQAGKVVVYQDGEPVWNTPENWQVVDLALGDPDDDGRQEMMMAFWRPDKMGVLRSHPFLVGYRGGTYHETWGGSGVSDPILELELGDVDGDHIQELIVLEQRKNGKQAVTVWDWHGWGFSLKWRSREGNFENLQALPGNQQGIDWISIDESNVYYLPVK